MSATQRALSHFSRIGLLTHLFRKLRSLWDIGGVDQDLQIRGLAGGVEAIAASALGPSPELLTSEREV